MRQRVAELERARDDALREQDRVGGDATAVTAELNAAKREIDDLTRMPDCIPERRFWTVWDQQKLIKKMCGDKWAELRRHWAVFGGHVQL